MRRLLGVLRERRRRRATAPQPGLGAAPELVERARAAGSPVTLDVEGEPRAAAAGLDLSAYRIVQEALTNVAQARGRRAGPCASTGAATRSRSRSATTGTRRGAPRVPAAATGWSGMRERVHAARRRAARRPAPGGGFAVARGCRWRPP